MQKIAGYLTFFGLGSIVLYFLNMEFVLLMWIDTWGTSVGWAIRIGMTLAGIALYAYNALAGRGSNIEPNL